MFKRVRFAWRIKKAFWYRLQGLTICRMFGHQYDDIATRMLGACGRCYTEWEWQP